MHPRHEHRPRRRTKHTRSLSEEITFITWIIGDWCSQSEGSGRGKPHKRPVSSRECWHWGGGISRDIQPYLERSYLAKTKSNELGLGPSVLPRSRCLTSRIHCWFWFGGETHYRHDEWSRSNFIEHHILHINRLDLQKVVVGRRIIRILIFNLLPKRRQITYLRPLFVSGLLSYTCRVCLRCKSA